MWVDGDRGFGFLWSCSVRPKLIRMVGQQNHPKLNPMRAYCVALSAAITVIIAMRGWVLPVSSTISQWVAFLCGSTREWHMERRLRPPRSQSRRGETHARRGRRRRKTGAPVPLYEPFVAAWVYYRACRGRPCQAE